MHDEAEIELKVHEIAACRPVMSEAGKRDLKADIAAHGLLVTIWTFEDEIIGGVDHYQACLELGIRLPLQEWKGEGPLIDVILSLNSRPQYTKGQLAVAAAKIANLGVGRPPGKAQICGITQAEVATKMGISQRQVQLAADLIRKGEPCLVEAVARGEVNLGPALDVAALDAREQIELVSSGPKAITRKAAEMRRKQKARKLEDQVGEVPVADKAVTTAALTTSSSPTELRPEDCPVRAKLADPTLFDKSVRLWQVVQEFLVQNDVAPFAADDPLYFVARHDHEKDFLDSVRMVGFPENWPLCRDCKGSGKGHDRSEVCDRCRGSGFKSARIPLACNQPAEGPPDGSTIDVGDPETGAGAGEDRTGGRRRKPARNWARAATVDGRRAT